MKNRIKQNAMRSITGIIAVAAVIVFGFTACTGSGGSGRNFTDVTRVEDWLANQKGGASPDDPISFSVKLNLQNMASAESNWQKLLTSINTAGLYVALDLSGSTMPNAEFNADGGIETGKQFIVSLVLPDGTESIAGVLYGHFGNLKTARARNIEWIIGSTGPAGGIVFYDKGDSTDGWRYLEAAPADMDTNLAWASPRFTRTDIPGTDTEIGTGKQNTASILSVDANAPAAKACIDYRGGGKDDWFLPSSDELNLMYRDIKENNFGGFQNDLYWSSSQANSDYAWRQYFGNGLQRSSSKDYSSTVRAVRAF